MASQVSCREIVADDVSAMIDLLLKGFPERPRSAWEQAFVRLAAHRGPSGYPKFGYLLAHRDKPVGLVLTCFSTVAHGAREGVRCNLSSWYVEPEFRCYGAMLSARAVARREVTYLNITPHPDTLDILAAQGYQKYCDGVLISIPLIGALFRAEVVPFDGHPSSELSCYENALLADHREYGCISVTCRLDGHLHPFVFTTTRTCRAPAAYLAYCRDIDDFARFAAPLGRFLARCGYPLVMLDANGPLPGLVGKYYGRWPKFFKGPDRPRIGDLAYTERPLFGV